MWQPFVSGNSNKNKNNRDDKALVRKCKAQKYLKLALEGKNKRPKVIKKHKVLSLADFKNAKTTGKLNEVKLITHIDNLKQVRKV